MLPPGTYWLQRFASVPVLWPKDRPSFLEARVDVDHRAGHKSTSTTAPAVCAGTVARTFAYWTTCASSWPITARL